MLSGCIKNYLIISRSVITNNEVADIKELPRFLLQFQPSKKNLYLTL